MATEAGVGTEAVLPQSIAVSWSCGLWQVRTKSCTVFISLGKAEAHPFAPVAADGDLAVMQQHGIPDDGETEAGAAHVAAAAFVDAVETFEDTG